MVFGYLLQGKEKNKGGGQGEKKMDRMSGNDRKESEWCFGVEKIYNETGGERGGWG